ncbi:MAG: hypothetical protein ACERKT_02740 [Acidobacteriota bacterium]|jgi:hypothetical protein
MSKFVLIYHGGTPPANDEEKDRMMAAWGQWMESAGEGLADIGNPLGAPTSIGGESADPATGYSILEAESSDHARQLLENHPMNGQDGARIDIYEAFNM